MDNLQQAFQDAIDNNRLIFSGVGSAARASESVSVQVGIRTIRANALRTIRGGQPVVVFAAADGGLYAVPESVVGRDDTESRDRNAEITRTRPSRLLRRRDAYFLIGVPRYVKALRVLVAFSLPFDKDEPVPLACPQWIGAMQDLGSGEEVMVCMPVPDLNGGPHKSFAECRQKETFDCPLPDPPPPPNDVDGPNSGGSGGSVYPPLVYNGVDTIENPNRRQWGDAPHGATVYVLRRPSGGITLWAVVTGWRETQDGRRTTRTFGKNLVDSANNAIAYTRKYIEESEVLATLFVFNPWDLYLKTRPPEADRVPACGTTITSDFPCYLVEYVNTTTFDQTTGEKISTTGELIGISEYPKSRTRIYAKGWHIPEKFPGCDNEGGDGGDGGDDDPTGTGNGGSGGGGGDGGSDPPEPDPPQCFRDEGKPDNVARRFYVGQLDEVGIPDQQIEISDADEYAVYAEAQKDGWSLKIKYGANGKAAIEGVELESGESKRAYCKKESFGSSKSGWQDPISTNLAVYSPKDIEDLSAEPWVKQLAGSDVNFVRENDKLYRYSIDRGQSISATNSLSNQVQTLESELKHIIPNSGATKDPIPVVIKKAEVNVDQSRDQEICVIVPNSEISIPGAIYRVAYRSLFPEDAIVSVNGCPVGEFEIEQLSPIKVD